VTAVAEDLDIERWVTFSGDEDDRCQRTVPQQCELEAVAAAWFDRACCPRRRNPLKQCAPHRDDTLTRAAEFGGFFNCYYCGATIRLLRMEPIR
jgi:hypothetical protein